MKIWQKYLFKRLTKTFSFFLVCLLAIYIVIDLSAHGVRFLSKSSFSEITLFYLHSFASLLDLFFTLTFLLAVMRILIKLNTGRELVALQMAGISKKRLLSPFFVFAGFLSLLCYLNSQWFSPDAQELASTFKSSHKTKKNKVQKTPLFTVSLEDESELIYQSFEKEKKELFDVFWVRTEQDIWHMKTLKTDTLDGYYVNHLTRNGLKQFEKGESFLIKNFSELPWNEEIVLHRFVPYESRSISTLLLQACSYPADARIVFSHLYYKLIVPLMPFLVLFALGPIAMRYSRNQPIFLVAAYSIFTLIALKVILDGMLILGENQVLPSYVAILSPMAVVLLLSLPSFVRMR